jgi:hypothetical protein
MNLKYNYDNININENENEQYNNLINSDKFFDMNKTSQNFLKKNGRLFNLNSISCSNMNNLNNNNIDYSIKKSFSESDIIEEKEINKKEILSLDLKEFKSNSKNKIILNNENNDNESNENHYDNNYNNKDTLIDVNKSIEMESNLIKINSNKNYNNFNNNNDNINLDINSVQKNYKRELSNDKDNSNDNNNNDLENENIKTKENSNSLYISNSRSASKSFNKSIEKEKLNLTSIPELNSNSKTQENYNKNNNNNNIINNNYENCFIDFNLNTSTEENFSQQILDQITQIKFMIEIMTKLITYKNIYYIDEKKEKSQIKEKENHTENHDKNLYKNDNNNLVIDVDIDLDIDVDNDNDAEIEENYSEDKLFLDPFYFKKGFLFQNYINNGILLDTNNFPKKGYTVLFAFKWEPLSNKAINKKCDLFNFYGNKIIEKSMKNLNVIFPNEKDEFLTNSFIDNNKKIKENVKLGMFIENKKLHLISEKDTYNTNIEILPGLSYLIMIKQKEYNNLVKRGSKVNNELNIIKFFLIIIFFL